VLGECVLQIYREGAKSAEYAESDLHNLFALSVLFASSR
jgi:hypothetical protein